MYYVRSALLGNLWQWRVNRRVRLSRQEIKPLLNLLLVRWLQKVWLRGHLRR